MRLFTHEKLSILSEELQGSSFIKEVWSGVLTTSIFKKLVSQSLDIYRAQVPALKTDKHCFLLLADVMKLELISAKDIEWLKYEVNPLYAEIGFTHQAVIAPKAQSAQKTVAEYEGEVQGLKTKMFTGELAAVRWFFNR